MPFLPKNPDESIFIGISVIFYFILKMDVL